MKLLPSSLSRVPATKEKYANLAIMSVYANCIRFNKIAANLLDLPARIAFDFDAGIITKDQDGWEVKISGSWHEFVIHSRSLTTHVLRKYGDGSKLLFRVHEEDGVFRITKTGDYYLPDFEQEIATALNVMP